MNLADPIDRNAAFTPDKLALRFAGGAWSYAEFADRIGRMAGALKSELGIRRGERVALLAQNHPDYLTLLYACARLGAVLVPLNWRLAPPELQFILSDADVRAVIVAQPFELTGDAHVVSLESIADLPVAGGGGAREPGVDWLDPLLIVYTAGTTGRPKGAVLTQQALMANAAMSQHMHD